MSAFAAFASFLMVAVATLASTPGPNAIRVETNLALCPSSSEVQSALGQVLGDGQWSSPGWVLSYGRDPPAGEADRDASLWMAFVDPAGERLVERHIPASPEDCHAIAGAMAAVVERSLRTLGWTRGEPLPLSARTTNVAETNQPPVQDSKPTVGRRPPRLVLGAGPSFGISPRTGTNLHLEARVRAAGPLCVRLGGGLLSGSDSQSIGPVTTRVTSRYFTLTPLAVFAIGSVELAGGPGLLFSFDRGRSNLVKGGSGNRVTLAVGAAIDFAIHLSPRWRLSAGFEGFRAALGSNYFVQIEGTRTVVLSPSPWEGIAAAKLEFAPWP
jgi:hypothetical protein